MSVTFRKKGPWWYRFPQDFVGWVSEAQPDKHNLRRFAPEDTTVGMRRNVNIPAFPTYELTG
ncbi:hypothetical protein AGMMS50256_09680 [Betaproteobacteria bacterium]|nr:hypothetical protein AGMMS50256_09680 [Betaproteobacteria bacterium]